MTDSPAVNDIPAILARADAATTGPWERYQPWSKTAAGIVVRALKAVEPNICGEFSRHQWMTVANAEFIAHSRTDVPNMAAEILSLRARLEEARAMRNDLIRRLGERAYPEPSRREKENG